MGRDERLEAEAEIAHHPGYVTYVQCRSIADTIDHVVRPNYAELLRLLTAASTDFALAIELVQNVRKSDVAGRFTLELDRHLHNYVSSLKTLVEHVYRVRDKRGADDAVMQAMAGRLPGLYAHPEVGFMKELRNMTQHRSLPVTSHTLSFANMNTPGQTMTSEVEFGVESLLAWDGWNEPTRSYIASFGHAMPIRPVLETQGPLVIDFNVAFVRDLEAANVGALVEVNELVVRRNAILSGLGIDDARALTDEWTSRRNSTAVDDDSLF